MEKNCNKTHKNRMLIKIEGTITPMYDAKVRLELEPYSSSERLLSTKDGALPIKLPKMKSFI